MVVIRLSNQQPSSSNQQQLIIHDALGRQILHKALDTDVDQVTVDLTERAFEDGVYQVSLRTDDSVVTKTLVVTKR